MPESKKPKADEAAAEAPATEAAAPVETAAPAAPVATVEAPAKAAKAKSSKKKDAATAAPEPKKEENLSLDPNAVVEQIKIIKAKGSKNIHTGIAHVLASFNNTIVSITDTGNEIGQPVECYAKLKGVIHPASMIRRASQ